MILALMMALASLCALEDSERQTVRFPTSDGFEIVADFYPSEEPDQPVVICLPMYRNVRESYAPIVEPLRERGLNVLALDLRGHGESEPALREKIEGRDDEVFNAMWKDVEAAHQWLRTQPVDVTRVGLLGASVGCSVALRSVVERPGMFRAAAVLTPGANYLGVDTLGDAGRWNGSPLLIVSSSEEAPNVKPVKDAFETHSSTEYLEFDGSRLHGTRMFGKVQVESPLADFFETNLMAHPVLCVPQFSADDERVQTAGFFGKTLRVQTLVNDAEVTLMAFSVGNKITLGGMINETFQGSMKFEINGKTVSVPFDTEDPRQPEHGDEGSGDPGIPVTVDGVRSERLKGSPAGFRGIHWISIEFDASVWLPEDQATLALELKDKERTIRLPAEEEFVVSRNPVRK